MAPQDSTKRENIPDACPHCGFKLTPWQQVLLGVDRALVCKNCWYRILLDIEIPEENKSDFKKSKGEEK
ncbi:hypothetical protein [Schleiferia thermophila]